MIRNHFSTMTIERLINVPQKPDVMYLKHTKNLCMDQINQSSFSPLIFHLEILLAI